MFIAPQQIPVRNPASLRVVLACLLGFTGCGVVFAQGFTDGHDDGVLTSGSVTWTAEGTRGWSETGGYVQVTDLQSGEGFLLSDYPNTDDGVFEVVLRTEGNNPANTRYGGFVFRYTPGHYYHVALRALDTAGAASGNGLFLLKNTTNIDVAQSGVEMFPIATHLNLSGFDRHYPLKVEISGATFTFYLNNVQVGQFTDSISPNLSGKVGYSYSNQWTRYVSVDWSRWTDAGASPLPPVLQSVFPADGAIHVSAGRQLLRLELDQDVLKGSGNVVIRDAAGNVVESVDVLSDQVGVNAPALLQGFESGAEEWTGGSRSTEQAHSGAYALKVVSSAGGYAVEALYNAGMPGAGFLDGSAWDSVVVWVWSGSAGASATPFVRSGDSTQAPELASAACVLVANSWNRCVLALSQSLDASRIFAFGLQFDQSGTFFVDDAGWKKSGAAYVTVALNQALVMDEVYHVTVDSGAFRGTNGVDHAGVVAGEWAFYTNRSPADILLSLDSIAEGRPAGSVVGVLSAVDADGAEPFSFQLVSGSGATDNAAFVIQGAQLRTAEVFDYNAQSSYSIRVQVQDGFQGVFAKVLTIAVTNVNETPTAIVLSSAVIAENAGAGAVVGALSTQDPDSGDVFSYTLVSGSGATHNALFYIAGNVLHASADLDYEALPAARIRVRSTDQGGLWVEQSFVISVLNRNDHVPQLEDREIHVAESSLPGTLLAQLAATDADGDLNPLLYTLRSGDDEGVFALTSAGVLSLHAALNYSVQSHYDLVVEVSDGLFTASALVRVLVVASVPQKVPGWNGEAVEVVLVDTVRNTVRNVLWNAGDTLRAYAQERAYFLLTLDSLVSAPRSAQGHAGAARLEADWSAEGIRVDGFLSDSAATELEVVWSATGLAADTLRVPLQVAVRSAPAIVGVRVHALYAESGRAMDLGDGNGMVVPAGADRLVFALTISDLPGCGLDWQSLLPATGLRGSWSGNVLTLSWERPGNQDSLAVRISNAYGATATLNLGWTYGQSLGFGTETTGSVFRIVSMGPGRVGFQIPRSGRVEVQLVDARGVVVQRQVQSFAAGIHALDMAPRLVAGQWLRVLWNGQSLVASPR